MRVALVFPGCSRKGGVERVMWEAANHLAGHHQVTVVAETVEDLPDGVEFLAVDGGLLGTYGGPLRPVAFRRAAGRALARLRPDVTAVYGSECPPGDVYVVGSVHRAWLQSAGSAEVRGVTVPGWVRYMVPGHLVQLALERSLFHGARGKRLVPCSDVVTDDLVRLYGLAGTDTTVINNGFSPEACSPERRHQLRAASRADLGYTDDDVVMVMVANEWQRKGLPVLLEAMHRLGDPSLHLLLVGRNSPADLLAHVTDPVVADRVRYVGPSDDVAVQHAAADLFVMPTQYEAFCLAIVEALASALPVITTKVPGAGDTILEDVNGLLLADPMDAEDLVGLLRRGLDGPTRQRWSEAAPATVAPYSWSHLMGMFEDVLVEVAEHRPHGG
jgi:UDP-glucose:(heptosyl)LPS alpha-1,3-glucosyltransferase